MRSIIKCPYYYFASALSKEMCEGVIDVGLKLPSKQAQVNDGPETHEDTNLRKGKVSWFEKTSPVHSVINNFVHQANYAAKWHFTLDDSEKVQFAQYKNEAFYGWHRDGDVAKNNRRKLSVTVQLSDPNDYEGGNFEMKHIWNDTLLEMDKETTAQGTIIIFPSMLPHRVTPVTKGVRKTLTLWMDGPRWK